MPGCSTGGGTPGMTTLLSTTVNEACSRAHRKCVRLTSRASSSVRRAAISSRRRRSGGRWLWQVDSSEPRREFASKHAESGLRHFPDAKEHAHLRRRYPFPRCPARA
jgi:hypothetical protein